MAASSPGLESTTTWGFEQISYFSELQFSHLPKGYDNIHGQRTAVRVKWVSSQPQLSFSRLLLWEAPPHGKDAPPPTPPLSVPPCQVRETLGSERATGGAPPKEGA